MHIPSSNENAVTTKVILKGYDLKRRGLNRLTGDAIKLLPNLSISEMKQTFFF